MLTNDYDYSDDYTDDSTHIEGVEFEETFDPDGYEDYELERLLRDF